MSAGSCAGCGDALDACSPVVFSVTQFGDLGEPMVAGYNVCSAVCLRDLGMDLQKRAAVIGESA